MSMIFGCGRACFSSRCTSLRVRPSRCVTSLMKATISGRCRSKLAASAGVFAGPASAGAQASSASRNKRHRFNYDPISFRREYSAIRIPKPASSVTTELPP